MAGDREDVVESLIAASELGLELGWPLQLTELELVHVVDDSGIGSRRGLETRPGQLSWVFPRRCGSSGGSRSSRPPARVVVIDELVERASPEPPPKGVMAATSSLVFPSLGPLVTVRF